MRARRHPAAHAAIGLLELREHLVVVAFHQPELGQLHVELPLEHAEPLLVLGLVLGGDRRRLGVIDPLGERPPTGRRLELLPLRRHAALRELDALLEVVETHLRLHQRPLHVGDDGSTVSGGHATAEKVADGRTKGFEHL